MFRLTITSHQPRGHGIAEGVPRSPIVRSAPKLSSGAIQRLSVPVVPSSNAVRPLSAQSRPTRGQPTNPAPRRIEASGRTG